MFTHFRIGYERNLVRAGNPGRREYYRIIDGHSHLEHAIRHALPPFRDSHFVDMWHARLAALAVDHAIHPPKPRPVVISIRFDNEVITVPMADSISVEACDGRIRRQLAAI